jgi:outer membrane protein OmpA-like peptidoglycan-associated protein
MNSKKTDFFWPSYTDLMTSLFFVMLVLYVLTYIRLNTTIKLQKEKLAIIETVEQNLKPLKSDSSLFKYEKDYKRFKLAFDVKFVNDKAGINENELEDFDNVMIKINLAGQKLRQIIDTLKKHKITDAKQRNVSYILVIAGYASRYGEENYNYNLSYTRALNLMNHWKSIGINFEAREYNDLIDLQIAGNGWGGVGRAPNEYGNQRFLIQIFPKIGDIQ